METTPPTGCFSGCLCVDSVSLLLQSQRSQTEAVTFLANHDDSRALYAIPGVPTSRVSSFRRFQSNSLDSFFKDGG